MVFIGYCHRGVKGPSPAEKGPRHPHWTSPPVIDVVAARGLDEGRLAWWRSIVSAVWYVAVCCHFLSGSSISALGSVRLCNLQPPPEREEWKAKKERERERMKLMMGNDHPSSIFPPFLVHGTTYFFFFSPLLWLPFFTPSIRTVVTVPCRARIGITIIIEIGTLYVYVCNPELDDEKRSECLEFGGTFFSCQGAGR